MRLLLIEDNHELAHWLSSSLSSDGYAVDCLADGLQADHALQHENYALAILDLSLPGRDGLDVLRRLRARGQTLPVLVVTARAGLEDRVTGLNLGADDYLAKPFELDELRARLHALLRRTQGYAGQTLQIGDLSFDGVNRSFYFRAEPLPLSRRESALLEVLVGRAGRAVSKEYLFEQVFGLEDDVNPEAVELIVFRLRKKLRDTNVVITSLRGLGYLLDARSADE